MLGSKLVSKVLCEGITIWDRSTVMPHMYGITNYYDCKKGLTSSSWENQASSSNDATLVGGTIAQDGALQVTCTEDSYGYFVSGTYNYGDVSLYAVFKCEILGNINDYRYVVGSCFGSLYGGNTNKWLSIGVDGKHSGYLDSILADLYIQEVNSNVSCGEYHVVTVVKSVPSSSNYVTSLYIDGVYIGNSGQYSYAPTGNKFAIGGVRSNESPYHVDFCDSAHPIQIKMLAVGYAAHSVAQVAQNSAWLRRYYGLGT